jgi:hypothetical protein
MLQGASTSSHWGITCRYYLQLTSAPQKSSAGKEKGPRPSCTSSSAEVVLACGTSGTIDHQYEDEMPRFVPTGPSSRQST